jgi:hypothetical protein
LLKIHKKTNNQLFIYLWLCDNFGGNCNYRKLYIIPKVINV